MKKPEWKTGGSRKKQRIKKDKKTGGLVRASLGGKSEGLKTFLGYFCCRLIIARNVESTLTIFRFDY